MSEREDVAFPDNRLVCSRCGETVERCSHCGLGFPTEQQVICRRGVGHEHGECSAHRMRQMRRSRPESP